MEEERAEITVSLQEILVLEGNKIEYDDQEKPEEEAEKKDVIGIAENLAKEIKKMTGGYEFKDKSLLLQAFTHHSFEENCSSYQRLEYVGDAVLNMLIAKELYFLYPGLDQGKLTKLRAANVDNEKLARVALNLNLHKLLRHKKPLFDAKIQEFKNDINEYPLHSFGLIDAPKTLADILESLVGAIFVDSNSMDTTWKIIKKLLVPMITPATLQINPVTMLYEKCQKHRCKVAIVDLWKEKGEIQFQVDGEFAGMAKYVGKRVIAYNRAALNAYHQIVKKLNMKSITSHCQDQIVV